jgi:hypothetical protein
LVVGLVVSVVLVAVLVLVCVPWWNFNLGGHFHPFGGWQGKGTLHSTTAGGDYTMWIQFELTARTRYRGPTLRGSGVLCSPRGEHVPLNVWANALGSHGADLTGVPLHVRMNRWMPLAVLGAARNPYLDFHGAFGDDLLILEDRGSVGLAFTPDGKVRESPDTQPAGPENIRFTLEKSTLPRLPAGCVI